ncbi:hypothetical protein C8R44DRAFT_752675 [Mycena epipterygia]|nr:hypothetical protein C8R44DRAFT_752675 [Mycena epipterygia]
MAPKRQMPGVREDMREVDRTCATSCARADDNRLSQQPKGKIFSLSTDFKDSQWTHVRRASRLEHTRQSTGEPNMASMGDKSIWKPPMFGNPGLLLYGNPMISAKFAYNCEFSAFGTKMTEKCTGFAGKNLRKIWRSPGCIELSCHQLVFSEREFNQSHLVLRIPDFLSCKANRLVGNMLEWGVIYQIFALEAEREHKMQNTEHRTGGGKEVDISEFAGTHLLQRITQTEKRKASTSPAKDIHSFFQCDTIITSVILQKKRPRATQYPLLKIVGIIHNCVVKLAR